MCVCKVSPLPQMPTRAFHCSVAVSPNQEAEAHQGHGHASQNTVKSPHGHGLRGSPSPTITPKQKRLPRVGRAAPTQSSPWHTALPTPSASPGRLGSCSALLPTDTQADKAFLCIGPQSTHRIALEKIQLKMSKWHF